MLYGLMLPAARGADRSRDFDFSLPGPLRWGELPKRLAEAAVRIFRADLLPALPALSAVLPFFALTRRGEADVLVFPAAFQILAYALACAFSAFGVSWLADASFARVTFAFFPLVALILSARLDGSPQAEAAS